ncbi:hypothetical protein CLBKND_03183 [Methylorubrum aminovorans]
MLPGCSLVGMVEAALYTNVGLVRHGLPRAVSWQLHLLVWGIMASEMTELRNGINRRVHTMIPGVKAAHFRQGSISSVALIARARPSTDFISRSISW